MKRIKPRGSRRALKAESNHGRLPTSQPTFADHRFEKGKAIVRRWSLCFAILALCFPGVGAAEDVSCEALLDDLHTISDEVSHDTSGQPDQSLVFYAFDRQLEIGTDRVEFDVRINGDVFLVEEVDLIKDLRLGEGDSESVSSATTIELLAAYPIYLERLHRLAENGERITVDVRLNGAPVETLTFSDLKAKSDVRRGEAALPQAITSRLSQVPYELPAEPVLEFGSSSEKSYCTQLCDDEQDDCYAYRCGQFGTESCYDACDYEWQQCMQHCGVCQESSTTSTVTTLESVTFLGPIRCAYHIYFGADLYARMRERYKVTTTTVTTNSDCSQTTSVAVTYVHSVCWKFYSGGCTSGPPRPFCALGN